MNSKNNPLRAEYLEHLEKQKTSGLSIKKYCVEINLVEHKLSYYGLYKLKSKKQSVEKSFSSVKITSPIKKTSFKIDPTWLAKFINTLEFNKRDQLMIFLNISGG